jgi:hypothetical protein
MCDSLSGERTGLPFTIAAGPRQRCRSSVKVPKDSWQYFTLSDSRLSQPSVPGPRIYIPPEQGVPVIPPGTGFPFRRFQPLEGLRWRNSNPPPRGVLSIPTSLPNYVKVKIMPRPTVQSANLSWNKAPIWGLRPDLYYCQTVAGLLMWGALSDDRTDLSFARLSQQ